MSPATVSLRPAAEAVVRVAVTRQGGAPAAVTLTPRNLPDGVTADPVTLPEDAEMGLLVLRVAEDAPSDTTVAAVEVEAPGYEPVSVGISLVVESWGEEGGFVLTLDPSPLSIRPDQSDSVEVTVTRVAPFQGPVELEVTDTSPGVTALVDPVEVQGTEARLLVEVAPGAPLADAGLTLVGRGPGVPEHAVRLVLTTFGAPFPRPGIGGPGAVNPAHPAPSDTGVAGLSGGAEAAPAAVHPAS